MKKHGFTLIELIVVIAIVGVLAGILVPAMIGYVKRAKITTSNSAAKSLYNGANVAMVEMEAYDLPPQKLQGEISGEGPEITAQKDYPYERGKDYNKAQLQCIFYCKITQYFSDAERVGHFSMYLDGYACTAVGVLQGRYPGSYPQKIGPPEFDSHKGDWTAKDAMEFALEDAPAGADVEGGL